MEFIFIVLPLLALIGYFVGVAYRNAHIKNTKARTLQKSEYALQDKLTPAEFQLLMKGSVNRNALAGEIIALQNQGYIHINRDTTGKPIATQTVKEWRNAQPLQRQLLASIFPRYAHSSYDLSTSKPLLRELRYYARKSLESKGWITPPRLHLTIDSLMPKRYYTRLGIALITTPMFMFVLGKQLGMDNESLFILTLLGGVVVLCGSVITALTIHLIDYFRRGAAHTLHVTEKYKAEYAKAYGVYIYLSVSGMDTMTPEYDSLEFSGLDTLYPYAVAVGMDKEVTRLLTQTRTQTQKARKI